MDMEQLNKKLGARILKALEITGKIANSDFDVATAAKRTQTMDPDTQSKAQKIQFSYAHAKIYAKLQNMFKGLKTNEKTEMILNELIDAHYFLVMREKQKAEVNMGRKAAMAAHKKGNQILVACIETLRDTLRVNLLIENLDAPEEVMSLLNAKMAMLKQKYVYQATELEKSIGKENGLCLIPASKWQLRIVEDWNFT